jgi:hypothetical protein
MYQNSSNQQMQYFKKKFKLIKKKLEKFSYESIVVFRKYCEQGKLSLNSIVSDSSSFDF